VSAQSHTSDPRILDRRRLARDHRRLAALLRPGMAVLDIGCGTGAITADIARAVGPAGAVIGIDRDPTLLRRARDRHAGVSGLRFEEGDVLALAHDAAFDVVTAARVLQWIEDPARALTNMVRATRPGGSVVALEYSHADLAWEPEAPRAVRRFYDAFLGWRAANGWDNRLAHRLPALFAEAGLSDAEASVEDEVATRGDPSFDDALAIWRSVMRDTGPLVVATGLLGAGDLDAAATSYGPWCHRDAHRQRMVLRAVVGRRPARGRS
jgi:SAM-dependent methyltransferase